MKEFIIKDFNSYVPQDTEFFRILTEKVKSSVPMLEVILNPNSENYQMFIALVQSLAYSCADLTDKTGALSRWIYIKDVGKDNLGLAVAVRMISHCKPEDFFKACNPNFDINIISKLKMIIKDTFNEVYENKQSTSIDSTNLFGNAENSLDIFITENIDNEIVLKGIRANVDESLLKHITVPDNITRLGRGCFKNNCIIQSVKIPNTVRSFGAGCFQGCRCLKEVNIPSDVVFLPDFCFQGCKRLKSIEVPYGVKAFGNYCFCACESLVSINIPNTVEAIGNNCFMGCSKITSIDMPNSVKKTGQHLFDSCSSLISLRLSESLTALPPYTINWCNSLEKLIVPDSIGTIYPNAICDCENLKTLYLPFNVKKVGANCIKSCNYLLDVYVTKGSHMERYCRQFGIRCKYRD